jgi:hypothetical protein
MADEKQVMTMGEKTNQQITELLKAKNTLIWIVTREERRVERAVIDAAGAAKYKVRIWDCASGLSDPTKPSGSVGSEGEQDPQAVLKKIRTSSTDRYVYVMRDLHPWIKDPMTLRLLRSTARELQDKEPKEARAIVVITPSLEIPPELSSLATVIEYPIPDRAEMERILDNALESLVEKDEYGKPTSRGVERRARALTPETREFAIDAAVGLTTDEAENCYAMSLVSTRGKIDPVVVSSEKKRIIAREKILTWTDPDPRGLDAVGGLSVLKKWLVQRKQAFSKEARAYGILPPKGIFLVGLPGTGKSLTAKCVAAAWAMPLLRIDFGALRSKFVGESEANLRKALRVAEAVSPCVLYCDEIEKAFAGASGPQGDGGVAADSFGYFLTWMQERQGAVFVIGTANDITGLPPEFLRKGRWDEVFWNDLPTQSERAEILQISIRASGRTPEAIDHGRVAAACERFIGSEIAALVPDAMFAAFADGGREITTEDLLAAAAEVTPLATTAKAKIDALREWAKGKARHASKAEEKRETGGRSVEFDADPTAN